MDSEQNLYAKIREGDEKAFNQVFELYYSRLCFYADNILHDFDLSRSIVQQVFVDLWINHQKVNILFSLKSFLFRAVRNKSYDELKHQKVEAKYIEHHLDKESEVTNRDLIEEAELNDKINSAILELPPRCREIFEMCRFEEKSYSEIASNLDISIKTVEMQISIALKKIRQKLRDSRMLSLISFIFSKKK